MFLAQQQQQQNQMAAFMQQHGYGPQGFGQGFAFGGPGMVHMLPAYQQASMFSGASVNGGPHDGGAGGNAAAASGMDGRLGSDAAPQLQQPWQRPDGGELAAGPHPAGQSGNLASSNDSCLGGKLGAGSSGEGSLPQGSSLPLGGSRHGSSLVGRAGSALGKGGAGMSGSMHGNNGGGSMHGSNGGGSGGANGSTPGSLNGSADGSGGRRDSTAQLGSSQQRPARQASQPSPAEDAARQPGGGFGGAKLYRPTASHARPAQSLSQLPMFAHDNAENNSAISPTAAATAATNAAAAPHNAPHAGFKPPPPADGGCSGASTQDRRSGKSSKASGWTQNRDSGRSSGGLWQSAGRGHDAGGADAADRDAAQDAGNGSNGDHGSNSGSGADTSSGSDQLQAGDGGGGGGAKQQCQWASPSPLGPPKRLRRKSPERRTAFEPTPKAAAAAAPLRRADL